MYIAMHATKLLSRRHILCTYAVCHVSHLKQITVALLDVASQGQNLLGRLTAFLVTKLPMHPDIRILLQSS